MMAPSRAKQMKRCAAPQVNEDAVAHLLVQFDRRFQSIDPNFGLRAVPDIVSNAQSLGYRLDKRVAMPSGNWWLLFVPESTATKHEA